jgi:hypothetical protein
VLEEKMVEIILGNGIKAVLTMDEFTAMINGTKLVGEETIPEIERNKISLYKKDRKEYFKEYNKKHYNPRNKIKVGTLHSRASSGKKWKKYEDKIIQNNSIKQSMKQLSHRTKVAIYARRSEIGAKSLSKISHYKRKIFKNDGRILMMQTVNTIVTKMHKEQPDIPLNQLRKQAFEVYRTKKGI